MRHAAKLSMMFSAVILLAGCATVVKPGQLGLKYLALHKPALQEEVRREGLYFQLPWNEVLTYNVTWQSKSEPVDVLTADDLHVRTTISVTFRPDTTRLYQLATEIGPEFYTQVIRPPFVTLARSEFAKHKHNNLSAESPVIETQVLAKLREALAGKPLQIDRIAIDHIEYDRAVTGAISSKIATNQMVEQKQLEVRIAEQDAEIARTKARGQADATRINAEGEAQAMIVRGEAQGKAQEAITRTLTPDYLRYKAFDNPATRYYFVPTGKDGMPLIINTEAGRQP